ncbi:uncharacterized protein LOC125186834 isoform X3 [Salvia hispanica]|uniref:uncharacterized protein LOC125186834 isoform X3 n=1 Tax=Salvia hispanica TaxID=49212 RepID=UPI002009A415|nr:uncharacterized protein LOC125186834 isoform X3 [Salvia hispanica]
MMLKRGKPSVLSIAEKCKNVLASNWQGKLNTIKADSNDSKEEIYSSRVKYVVQKGRPYIWVPEKELHNVNTIIDERGSFAVSSPIPGPLASILKSVKKLPARVALIGDAILLEDEKAKLAAESLKETLLADQKAVEEINYSVSGILNSSHLGSTSRVANLQELLQGDAQYNLYKFKVRSCTYIDTNAIVHKVNPKDVENSKADRLAQFSMSLIDGINRSETRRRALILFCITFLNENAKDAFILSVDMKGFDVLAKVLGSVKGDGSREYQWKELRFGFKDEASDAETFCQRLLEMEEEALKKISSVTVVARSLSLQLWNMRI